MSSTWIPIGLGDIDINNGSIAAGIASDLINNASYIQENRAFQGGLYWPPQAATFSFLSGSTLTPTNMSGTYTDIFGTEAYAVKTRRGLRFSTDINTPVIMPVPVTIPSKTRFIDVLISYELENNPMDFAAGIEVANGFFPIESRAFRTYNTSDAFATGTLRTDLSSLPSYAELQVTTSANIKYSKITIEVPQQDISIENTEYVFDYYLKLLFESRINTSGAFDLYTIDSYSPNTNSMMFIVDGVLGTNPGVYGLNENDLPGPFHQTAELTGFIRPAGLETKVYLYLNHRDILWSSKGSGVYQYYLNFYNKLYSAYISSDNPTNIGPNGNVISDPNLAQRITDIQSRFASLISGAVTIKFYRNSVINIYGIQYRTRTE
jgi:hypothetical protein